MMKGHLLNERYKIIKKIGSGGMADVYLARDTILERNVAIKALRSDYVNDHEFTTRFDREAQAATSLSHPNIVNIFDVGEEGDILYMVMEYVDGLTLKEYIQQYGPIEVEEALDIMKQIVSAIAHAHDNDLVHRDIKPQNILINNFGQAKVTDFGIAIALSATSLTQTNSILGSVHYLSPEQARGGMATKKSDIYSIGIVFFELLTGRLPFSGQSPVSVALKHLQNETPSVRRFNQDIPQSLENVVLQATAKDPFHRYASVYELEDAIETVLAPDRLNEPPFTPPVEVGEETMAIPILTDDQFIGGENQETIISPPNGKTRSFAAEEAKDEENKSKEKPKKKKKRKWLLILSILFVLLAGTAVALFLYPGFLVPKDVELPDVIGWEYEEAKAELESRKLSVEQEFTYTDENEPGTVVEMKPVAGRTVKEKSSVTLVVELPDFIGAEYDEAKEELENLGLTVEQELTYSNDIETGHVVEVHATAGDDVVTLVVSEGKELIGMEDYVGEDFETVKESLNEMEFDEILALEKYSEEPAGQIITQIQPSPGTEVVPSETKVIFEVSLGLEPINLNNLTGMTLGQAEEYLNNNDLQMQKHEEYSSNVEEGRVIRQSPESGTEMKPGDTVEVYISLGQEDIPPKTSKVTSNVIYTGEENPDSGEPVEQVVKVFVGDVNNNIIDVYEEITITEDTAVTFTVLIPLDGEAEYIITRDDQMVESDIISYEDGD